MKTRLCGTQTEQKPKPNSQQNEMDITCSTSKRTDFVKFDRASKATQQQQQQQE